VEFESNLRLEGQYFDSELGLAYNRHRYYDDKIGQYISLDPIGLDAGTENFYQFGFNIFDYSDPLGLWNKRRKNGRFASKPGPKPKPSMHGNSAASTKPAALYSLYDEDGNFKKWGITQEVNNLRGRYGNSIPRDWDIRELARGKRSDMLKLERELTSKSQVLIILRAGLVVKAVTPCPPAPRKPQKPQDVVLRRGAWIYFLQLGWVAPRLGKMSMFLLLRREKK
jgi:RHS repeat-associated protein